MNIVKWMPVFFLACMGCAKPFTLTAFRDNSAWFGTGEITEIHTQENKTCLLDRFSLTIRTDLPFDQQTTKAAQKVTGCVGQCMPTQWLGIYNIPLTKGAYDLARPDTCLPTQIAKSSQSFTVVKSSLLLMNPQTGNTQMSYHFSERDKGWVQVTRLNRTNGRIRGRFDLTLSDPNGQTIHFKRGKFSGKLLRQ